ncbi:DUF1415 domain-containing protein [Pleionea sediminis]|uniref:DUF1415 domain-containing protein n=1 Tax=Pleionea sediminis TaxID=2569479 RepID=UPI0011854DB0|nr:DUF1415 domain-containing protein [Pleionea sediminis]
MTEQSRDIIETKRWLECVVIGENFCPFAKPVFDDNKILYIASMEQDFELALMTLIRECHHLDNTPDDETTLLIFSKGFKAFDDFLILIELAENLLIDQGYEGVYQLAHFHPEYCFEGCEEAEAQNYTNRSPFPTLHIIREASIEKALQSVKSPENIPQRNIRHANKKGADYWRSVLQSCIDS